MSRRLEARVVPPRGSAQQGWHFPQTDGTITEGYSRDDLILQITNYRISNGLELGQPEQELEIYLDSRRPGSLRSVSPNSSRAIRKSVAKAAKPRPLLEAVRTATKLIYSRATPWKHVPNEESARRQAICLDCPANTAPKKISQCGECIKELNRMSVVVRANKPVDKTLGICAATFQDLRIGVFLPKEALERSLRQVEETPAFCWLRDLA